MNAESKIFPEGWVEGAATRERGTITVDVVHPQWGGYSGNARVSFDADGSANRCFELQVWHDGEFPASESNPCAPFERHCCSPEQFVEFGIDVIAAMVKHQKNTQIHPQNLRALAQRLVKLAEEQDR